MVIGALAANARVYAAGMGCEVDAIGEKWNHAIASPIPPREVAAAPCQEVVITGDGLRGEGNGLDALPIPVSTPGFDAAPYITAGLWITKDPEDGVQNMGMYRGQLKAPDRLAVMMLISLSAGGYFHWKKYRDGEEKMSVAVVLGAPPVMTFAGPQKLKIGVDELGVAGGIASPYRPT